MRFYLYLLYILDGKTISKQAQFIEPGQTRVPLVWNIPDSQDYSTYDIQGKVDLYGTTEITNPVQLKTYPDTITLSAYDMKRLTTLEKDGEMLRSSTNLCI